MKICTACKSAKPLTEYQRDRTLASGYRSRCKACCNGSRRGTLDGRTFDTSTPDPPPRTIHDDIADRREKAETASLKRRLHDALAALEQTRFELEVATAANDARRMVDPVERRERSSVLREATAVALLSDAHIEETVDPRAVAGVNAYNLTIAERRINRFFSGFVYMLNYHADHFAIRDAVLWLGGDLITGYLHPDQIETNQLSPVQAIATLHVWLADGIRYVLANSDVEVLRVPCSSGNHGRLTEKMRVGAREANSIEWLLYTSLAREFANEPRVQFSVPAGSHTYVDVYDWTIRFLHGDDTRYGGGVGGVTIPIYKALARWQTVRHAHLTCLGHYHSLHTLPDLVINGSVIGYGPYSLSIGARYEEPQQAFFLIDSRRGLSMPSSIWVKDADEEAELWRGAA